MSKNSFKIKKGLTLTPVDPSTLTTPEVGDVVIDSTDSNKLKTYDGVDFSEVSADASKQVFNYIGNSGAEVDLSGWVKYKNTTAGPVPDDFGGTASSNFGLQRTTSDPGTPLKGVASFELFKVSTADLSGHGVYYEFDAELGHLASKMLLEMLTLFGDGTTESFDGDFRVYLVSSSDDFVADFNVISPNNPDLLASNKVVKMFQLDASDTKYRLCIHFTYTGTEDRLLFFDDVSLAPKTIATGAVVTDFKDYTPTIQGLGTPTINYAKYRRVGDSLHINIELVSGTPTATELQIGLPDGHVVHEDYDTTFLSMATRGHATDVHHSVLATGGDTYLNIGTRNGSTNFAYTKRNGNSVLNSGNTFGLDCVVKIQGFSSNAVSSEDLGSREIVAEGAGNGGTSITADVTNIDFTETRDTTSSFDGTTLTAPETGDYLIAGAVRLTGVADVRLSAYIDGTLSKSINTDLQHVDHPFYSVIYLEKGQELTIRSSGTVTLSNDSDRHHIHISKLASPQTILETEIVAARYTSNSGQSIGTSATDLIYEDLDYDTHDAYNPSTGEYTIPVSGKYQINVRYLNATSNNTSIIAIEKNGSEILNHRARSGSAATNLAPLISEVLNLEKGDVIIITGRADNSSSMNTSGLVNAFSIARVK